MTAVFTTRYGGVSTGPWSAANLALHVGDDRASVRENRRLLAARLGGLPLAFPQQVHGPAVAVLDSAPAEGAMANALGAPGADALVTRLPGVPIAVLVADCIPVLLADPVHGVIGAAHAGRRGLAQGVLRATVTAMCSLGAEPGEITAVVGPAICGRCYEVPAQMRDEVDAAVPGTAATTRAGTPALDLPAGAVRVLDRLGLAEVRATGICTLEDTRFYSYRRDGHDTGRFAGVVMLDADD